MFPQIGTIARRGAKGLCIRLENKTPVIVTDFSSSGDGGKASTLGGRSQSFWADAVTEKQSSVLRLCRMLR